MSRLLRAHRPSLVALEESDEEHRKVLLKLIRDSANLDETNASILNNAGREMKNALNIYTMTNRALLDYHLKHGNIAETKQIRLTRYSIQDDVSESLYIINACLKKLDFDLVSEIESCSHPSIYPDRKTASSHESFYPATSPQKPSNQHHNRTEALLTPANVNIQQDLGYDLESTVLASHLNGINLTTPAHATMSPNIAVQPSHANVLQNVTVQPQHPPTEVTKVMPHPSVSNIVYSPSRGKSPQPVIHGHQYFVPSNLTAHVEAPLHPIKSSSVNRNHHATKGKSSLTASHGLVSHIPGEHGISFQAAHPEKTSHHTASPTHRVSFNRLSTPFQHPYQQQQSHVFHPAPADRETSLPLPIDSTLCHRLKGDLLKGLGDPFKGDAEFYSQWKTLLRRRIEECRADSLDSIQILIANTDGNVKATIKNYMAAGINRPDETLVEIWELLDSRYGLDHHLAVSVEERLHALPENKESVNLQTLQSFVDICRVASSAMLGNIELSYLNTARGINIILGKLPKPFTYRWSNRHLKHKNETGCSPDFHLFVEFLSGELANLNLPYFQSYKSKVPTKLNAKSFQTSVTSNSKSCFCYYHQSNGHDTPFCRKFAKLNYTERRKIASDNKLCFNCLEAHMSSNCPNKHIKCKICNLNHVDAMHRSKSESEANRVCSGGVDQSLSQRSSVSHSQGGNSGSTKALVPQNRMRNHSPQALDSSTLPNVTNACTQLCGGNSKPRICSKTFLVDISHRDRPGVLRALCILDEQSNASFCDDRLVEFFQPPTQMEDYSLSTMNGSFEMQGLRVFGLRVRGVLEDQTIDLPPMLTHPELPDTSSQVATRGMVLSHPHIASFAKHFSDPPESAQVLMLIGADCGDMMRSATHGDKAPYIHQTPLGYSVVGPVCLHNPTNNYVSSFCTAVNVSTCHPTVTVRRSFVPDYSKFPLSSSFETRDDDEMKQVDIRVLATDSQTISSDLLPAEVCKRTNSWCRALSLVSTYFQLSKLLLKRDLYRIVDAQFKAKVLLIRYAQNQFQSQINLLKKHGSLPGKDVLSSLSPIIGQDGIIRVGGRLRNADFPPDEINPVLLPTNHPVTWMIIQYYHEQVKHQGRMLTHGALRQAGFHVLHGSRALKKFLLNCTMCKRIRGRPSEQMMADLPTERLEALAPFTHVGIDCFGPYFVYDGKSTRRRNASKKVWLLLVTCLASRANHIEILPSMDTSAFELALRRFFAVRGTCSTIFSDQGSNFLGAINQSVDFNRLVKMSASQGIRWELNPPLASNFGGIWERKIGAIKSVFSATLQLLGNHDLSRDEFSTLIIEATSIVNNTPLWGVSGSPDDPCPLSPARLLTLKESPNPPSLSEFTEEDLLQYGKRRWRRIMFLADQFWIRWRRFYLSELQERKRWKRPSKNMSVGDIVLLKGPAKRNTWPLARVSEIRMSRDGLVRRVTVKVASEKGRPCTFLERSVRDLVVVLPVETQN